VKKKTPRRTAPVKLEETQARIDSAIDQFQEAWEEELFSDAPSWGIALGIHLRLCELEHLEQACEELML
jgi:hypothetical protein